MSTSNAKIGRGAPPQTATVTLAAIVLLHDGATRAMYITQKALTLAIKPLLNERHQKPVGRKVMRNGVNGCGVEMKPKPRVSPLTNRLRMNGSNSVPLLHDGATRAMSIAHKALTLAIKPLLNERHQAGLSEGHQAGLSEGRSEGRAEERAEWQQWLRRRNEAEAQGRPFDEPPPGERQ